MSNTNCLENRKCPKCGQEDRFHVAAQSIFVVVDDGTDGHYDVEYDDESYADCPDCGWWGCWKQTEDADFMTQKIWNRMEFEEQDQWKEQRGIVTEPRCLAPYLGKRIVAISESFDEEVIFWVGESVGWKPVYLECQSEWSNDGLPAHKKGYWDIRELEPDEKVVPRDARDIRNMKQLLQNLDEARRKQREKEKAGRGG